MLFPRIGLVFVSYCTFSFTLYSGERIDPAGIPGSLILSEESVPGQAMDQFYSLSGENPRIVILVLDGVDSSNANATRISKLLSAKQGSDSVVIKGNPDSIAKTLQTATGVWLVGENFNALRDSQHQKALDSVLNRGAVIGAGGKVIEGFGENGAGFFPGAQIEHISSEERKQDNAVVHYQIGTKAALLLKGRRIRLIGEGEVKINLLASKAREEKKVILQEGSRVADLTALRLAAIARNSVPFPSNKPPDPLVENGTLIIIGGGPMPRGIMKRFITLAGGDEASIVFLPTAVPDPIPKKIPLAKAFRDGGAKNVTVLSGRTLQKVDSDEYLEVLKNATGIWFGGGRQWRFADAYLDTKAHELMREILKRGGVIMGSSAGASIQADYLARANPLGNRDIMAEGYERGLGFIQGVAIDQHFAERNRFKDMSSLVDQYPQLLGIGIDEGTALIVERSLGSVIGKGQVHFYDRGKPTVEGDPDYESVGGNGKYELIKRKVLNTGATKNVKP